MASGISRGLSGGARFVGLVKSARSRFERATRTGGAFVGVTTSASGDSNWMRPQRRLPSSVWTVPASAEKIAPVARAARSVIPNNGLLREPLETLWRGPGSAHVREQVAMTDFIA